MPMSLWGGTMGREKRREADLSWPALPYQEMLIIKEKEVVLLEGLLVSVVNVLH
jgi:hypothetical protein